MIADYFTKPVQGGLFCKFRDRVLGIKDSDDNIYKQEYAEAMERFGLNQLTAE